jgi:hypothetical protein
MNIGTSRIKSYLEAAPLGKQCFTVAGFPADQTVPASRWATAFFCPLSIRALNAIVENSAQLLGRVVLYSYASPGLLCCSEL